MSTNNEVIALLLSEPDGRHRDAVGRQVERMLGMFVRAAVWVGPGIAADNLT